MKTYQDMLKHILANGVQKGDRTGTGTISTFGYQMRFDLNAGFPLLTTKKLSWKFIAGELLWLISGSTNVKPLQEQGITIWDEWADPVTGELGPVYGRQWRKWPGFDFANASPGGCDEDYYTGPLKYTDQLAEVIERIKTKPDCPRLIVSAWNPNEVPLMKLPPCHCFFQFYVANGKLSCHMYQRSADAFLGVPYNIASYALLTHMVAHVTKLQVGELVHSFGDLHIYNNHQDQVREQLQRKPFVLPGFRITAPLSKPVNTIDDFTLEHLHTYDYYHHPAIKGEVSV